jgi:hypothetical protein
MADTITLTWNDKKYFVIPSKIMRARQAIESVYPLKELASHMSEGTPRLVQLSMAFGALLRFAGANAEDSDIYDGMFGENSTLGADAADMLFKIMIPEKILAGGEEPQANPTPPSKNSSKSASAKAG